MDDVGTQAVAAKKGEYVMDSTQTQIDKLTERALASVADERAAQIAKWGKQDCNWAEFVSILTEEVGEAAMDANKARWAKDEETAERHVRQLRTELVQTAAVAVQIIEHIDETLDLLAPTPPLAAAPDEAAKWEGDAYRWSRVPSDVANAAWRVWMDDKTQPWERARFEHALETAIALAAPADRAVVVTDELVSAVLREIGTYPSGAMVRKVRASLQAALRADVAALAERVTNQNSRINRIEQELKSVLAKAREDRQEARNIINMFGPVPSAIDRLHEYDHDASDRLDQIEAHLFRYPAPTPPPTPALRPIDNRIGPNFGKELPAPDEFPDEPRHSPEVQHVLSAMRDKGIHGYFASTPAPDEAAKWDDVGAIFQNVFDACPFPVDAHGIPASVHAARATVAKAIELGLAAPAYEATRPAVSDEELLHVFTLAFRRGESDPTLDATLSGIRAVRERLTGVAVLEVTDKELEQAILNGLTRCDWASMEQLDALPELMQEIRKVIPAAALTPEAGQEGTDGR